MVTHRIVVDEPPSDEGFLRQWKTPLIAGGAVVGSAVVLITALSCATQIHAGYRGVKTTWGAVSEEVLDPGLHFTMPFSQAIHPVYVGINKVEEKLAAASSDKQTVTVDFSLNYHVSPRSVVNIYSNLANDQASRVIQPAMIDTAKAIISHYDTNELINKRDLIGTAIETAMREKLKPFGIEVDKANLLNIDFSPEYNSAIEAAASAQQRAIQSENEVKQAQYDAQKGVVQSAARLQIAENDAKANDIIGKSLADNPSVLEQRKIDKWDGHYPQFVGTGATPFIQVK
jgi:prohibitin 2